MRQVSKVPAGSTARWVSAGSAVAVGTFGWLLAHVVTFWLATHSHHGSVSLSTGHVHGFSAAATVVAGSAAAACVMAMVLATGWLRGPGAGSTAGCRATVHRAVGLSTGAFFAADAVEHAGLGLAPTTPALVVLGVLLHAVFGAGSSLLWISFTDRMRRAPAALRPVVAGGGRRLGMPHQRSRRSRRLLWAAAVADRAPPSRLLMG